MQGVFYQMPSGLVRIQTKKDLKVAARDHPEKIKLEQTSIFGDDEFDGWAETMPANKPVYVVGPDPYTDRKWYATIERKGTKLKVS